MTLLTITSRLSLTVNNSFKLFKEFASKNLNCYLWFPYMVKIVKHILVKELAV